LHLYNWELVEQIAKDEEVSTQLVAKLEGNMPTELEEWMAELLASLDLKTVGKQIKFQAAMFSAR